MELTKEFKDRVVARMLEQRANFGGSDTAFARSIDINPSVYNRLKKGDRDKLLPDAKWVQLGRELDVRADSRRWVTVETDVYLRIREEIMFCKRHSKNKIFVDECGIGKTYTAQVLAKTEKNVFYLDCLQCGTETGFIRALARMVGLDSRGKIEQLKADTKYYFSLLNKPVVILDEAAGLKKGALERLHEYMNATDGQVGWYIMGANSLKSKILRGISGNRESFAELYSRLSEQSKPIVPVGRQDRYSFYKKLIRQILQANIKDKSKLDEVVKRCLVEVDGRFTGVRRAESLMLLYEEMS